jgi:hypothetical protein
LIAELTDNDGWETLWVNAALAGQAGVAEEAVATT